MESPSAGSEFRLSDKGITIVDGGGWMHVYLKPFSEFHYAHTFINLCNIIPLDTNDHVVGALVYFRNPQECVRYAARLIMRHLQIGPWKK